MVGLRGCGCLGTEIRPCCSWVTLLLICQALRYGPCQGPGLSLGSCQWRLKGKKSPQWSTERGSTPLSSRRMGWDKLTPTWQVRAQTSCFARSPQHANPSLALQPCSLLRSAFGTAFLEYPVAKSPLAAEVVVTSPWARPAQPACSPHCHRSAVGWT